MCARVIGLFRGASGESVALLQGHVCGQQIAQVLRILVGNPFACGRSWPTTRNTPVRLHTHPLDPELQSHLPAKGEVFQPHPSLPFVSGFSLPRRNRCSAGRGNSRALQACIYVRSVGPSALSAKSAESWSPFRRRRNDHTVRCGARSNSQLPE